MKKKMFDFVIGNPPYNADFSDSGDNGNFAKPVYNQFIDAAVGVSDKVELIHPARFLFNAGSTPKEWNQKMLNDEHFKVIEYEDDAAKVFPNTDIKGGIAITYYNNLEKYEPIKTFTAYPELNTILRKAGAKEIDNSLSSIMDNQTKFDLDALYKDYPAYQKIIGSNGRDKRFRNNIFEKIDLFTESKPKVPSIKAIGVQGNKRIWRYIPSKYCDTSQRNINKWKGLVARVNNNGRFGETLSTPIVERPLEGYTQTFIGIGAFDTQEEAENVVKYVKTKFARALLGVLKITQDNSIDTWRYIPLQDFTSSSDIAWSVSISEIDKQLYAKYGLSEEEISFIETNVKEMV